VIDVRTRVIVIHTPVIDVRTRVIVHTHPCDRCLQGCDRSTRPCDGGWSPSEECCSASMLSLGVKA
jgi:hypothetical protein